MKKKFNNNNYFKKKKKGVLSLKSTKKYSIIQSGLVNTLAKGMAQSYTDLAAQHAVVLLIVFIVFAVPAAV